MSHRTFMDDPHGTSDRARQGLLDNRSEHKTKRHRTLGRRKRLSAKKKLAVKHAAGQRDKRLRTYYAKARAYWRGDAPDHPEI